MTFKVGDRITLKPGQKLNQIDHALGFERNKIYEVIGIAPEISVYAIFIDGISGAFDCRHFVLIGSTFTLDAIDA